MRHAIAVPIAYLGMLFIVIGGSILMVSHGVSPPDRIRNVGGM